MIEEKQFGPDHPDIATILSNLAILLCAKRDYVDAEQSARRALDIFEKKFGPKNSRTEQARANLELILNRKLHRANN